MPEWVIGLICLAVTNVGVWVFLWGGWRGKVNTRLNNLEKNADAPPILPQCAELFAEIRENMAAVSTKVNIMYNWMNEDKKNNEKKQIRSKGKSG